MLLEAREDELGLCRIGPRLLLLEVRVVELEAAPPAIRSNCSGVSSFSGLLMVV